MKSRGLEGMHLTSPHPHAIDQLPGVTNGTTPLLSGHCNGSNGGAVDDFVPVTNGKGFHNRINRLAIESDATVYNGHARAEADDQPGRLLVFSASDEQGIGRLADSYESLFRYHQDTIRDQAYLDHLSYTLCARRSTLPWKSFAVVSSIDSLKSLGGLLSKPVSTGKNINTIFIFTGQGAQYRNMGVGLLSHPRFKDTIDLFDRKLNMLGCTWSVANLLLRQDSVTDIDDPEYSQAMTTAVQMALYDLLQVLGIKAALVVGHSSGEIAAAYASGALSLSAACKVSYFRGKCASTLKSSTKSPGAMMSVNLPEEKMRDVIKHFAGEKHGILCIACINSPYNVTISGNETAIDAIQVTLTSQKVHTRKLNTGVAYHSPCMDQIAQQYAKYIGDLSQGTEGGKRPVMISSISGENVRSLADVCTPKYWVENMLSPVQFSKAMSIVSSALGKKRTRKLGVPKVEAEDVVEIGPHSALRRPVVDCLEHYGVTQAKTRYHSTLSRHGPAIQAVLNLVGELYTRGYPVNIQKANEIGHDPLVDLQLLTDIPSYPFDHSRRYWHESAIGRHSRVRATGRHELLGVPVSDWNPLEPRWRKFFDLADMPWIGHHQVNGRIIYPAAGMVAMAIQGSSQIADPGRQIDAYQIRDAVFTAPITIGKHDRTEAQLHMRLNDAHMDKSSTTLGFRVYSASATGWFQNCSGTVQVLYKKEQSGANDASHERENLFYRQKYKEALQSCTLKVPSDKMYNQFKLNGLQYGPCFQPLENLAWDGKHDAIGDVRCFGWNHEYLQHDLQPHVVHPTVLDAVGQLPWVGLTKGATETVVNGAAVTRIQHAWIANSGLSYPSTTHIQACCTTSFKGLRGTDSSIFALDLAGNVVLRVSHMETTAVGGDEKAFVVDDPRKICFEMSYKPDMAMLDTCQLDDLTNANLELDEPPVSFYEDLDLVIFYFATQTLRKWELFNGNEHDLDFHISRYVAWLNRQLNRYHRGELPHGRPDWNTRIEDTDDMEKLICKLEETNAEGRFFVHVGRNLRSIIQGFTDPLEIMFQSGLAEQHYQAVCDQIVCCKQLLGYLDLLSHKNPQLKVLEIGAGTGSITRHVLQGLNTHFRRYDYTDISGAFFEKAREKFADFAPKINYSVLDIETDPVSQGYDAKSYDVIVAAWVLHATRDLAITIRNVRNLLKPGGKLILLEITEPGLLRNGVAFGTLPGWWLSTEPEREWSPCMSETKWAQILEHNGFKGVDIVLPDYNSDLCHENSILIATNVEHETPTNVGVVTDITLVIAPHSRLQAAVAGKLQSHLQEQGSGSCSILSLGEESLMELTNKTLVFMAELNQSYLSTLNKPSFEFLRDLLSQAQTVIWVTSSPNTATSFPECQMIRGLARVLFTERPGLVLATLSFESPSFNIDVCTRCTSQVISATVAESTSGRELEYVERNGLLMINRVFDSNDTNQRVHSKTHTMVRHQSLRQSPPLSLIVPSSGLLDSIRWGEDARYWDDLGVDEIEIKVQAMGVNFRDLLVMLGKYSASTVGCECAGIVTRIGKNCDTLKPGDRVCACLVGCSNTHARCHYQLAVKIPDFLTTAEAASLPTTGVTAHYSLVTLANLQKEDSILIHSATGGTGQMALQIAQSIGADVYVTVGTEEKKRLVQDLYGVPENHIFYSRDTTFARDLYRATGGKGVDVVINSLSKEALIASWECIAPFGRFIELGKMDIENNSRLPMSQFSKNVTFHAVAADHLASQRPLVVGRILQSVIHMIGEGKIKVASPLHLHPVSELENAFRIMQSGKNMGKMVLTFSPLDVVPVSSMAYPCLHFLASYQEDKRKY